MRVFSEFIDLVIIIALASYCWGVMSDLLNRWECEQTHNVYRCEKIEQWVPAAWTPEDTK